MNLPLMLSQRSDGDHATWEGVDALPVLCARLDTLKNEILGAGYTAECKDGNRRA